ncbi:cysteine hydrolase family protein [Kineothrix sp. MB12-C1]|uniref:cysteine hydrolase family protein n=1 Tax=Kineothrix sp. MB12-C1 TaxID=3070215 RepID=UPI0027D2552C|nr:isochorismatase family cysteine hydrolase [Kineothrix sp. MB12-C1]WMC93407.1 isochorismatase family cysteine hydrolase [Kineothrix sp. MB12-C1]
MNYLIVVDMQNDFVDGALGTKEAISIVPKVVEKIKNFSGKILYTKDTHEENYMETQEGRNLPVPHCIKDTKGWMLCPEVEALCTEEPITKPTFGSVTLGQVLQEMNEKEPIDSITLIGLCTDICIISNAFLIKAVLPEVPIVVDASCCAGVTPESHKRALESMRTCHIQIENE